MQALDSQFYAFFTVSLAGMASGLLFDLLRVVRGRMRPWATIGAAADLVYWAVVTLVLGIGLFTGNWGDLRFYVVMAVSAGAYLYFVLAGPVARWVLSLLVGTLLWLWDATCYLVGRMAVAPAMWLALFIWRMACWAGEIFRRIGREVAGLAIYPVYRILRLTWMRVRKRVTLFLSQLRHWLFRTPPPDPPPTDREHTPVD